MTPCRVKQDVLTAVMPWGCLCWGEIPPGWRRPGSEVWPRLRTGDKWAAGYFIPFGGTQAIQEYYDLSKDEQARTIILAAARQLIGAKHSWSWPGPQQQLVAGAGQLPGHLLKGFIELPDLILAVDREHRREIAGGYLLGGGSKGSYWSHDATHHRPDEEEGAQHDYQADEDQHQRQL